MQRKENIYDIMVEYMAQSTGWKTAYILVQEGIPYLGDAYFSRFHWDGIVDHSESI